MSPSDALERLARLVGDFEPGTVSLVGSGPGDSALISVRGAVRVAQADVILHDKLIGPELLELAGRDAERIFVGKWRGEKVWTQEQINAALVEQARAGRRVVRLKGGDPFVFGRGGEECEHLAAAGVRYEVVPGITAAFGAPAAAGIPLTHRGLSGSFALVTGHLAGDQPGGPDYTALARMETIAIYMGVKTLGDNCRRLMAAGLAPDTPVAVIRWGTRPRQQTVTGTLADIDRRVQAAGLDPPALVLVGKVVTMRERIEWFERRPLHGQVIVVTRMRGQAAGLSGPLLAAGAEVIEAPTIELADVEDHTAIDAAIRRLADYDWLVLTSTNGVDAFFARLAALGLDARALAGVKVAAVGTATAQRVRAQGIRPDLVPEEASGEALAEAVIAMGARDRRFLLPRADIAREQLPAALRAAGGECDDLPVYRTVRPASLPEAFLNRFDAGEIDWITLTSPSSFVNLLALLGPQRSERLARVRLASIGPTTTQAVRQAGFEIACQAEPHDAPGLVAAIRRTLGK
ncbi:MAG: uroporphyrinogen-III C-methyltransferase [Phycisphaerae bacterium]